MMNPVDGGSVLITGVGGFAGRVLAEQYRDRGWEVHGTVRGSEGGIAGVGMHSVDLLQGEAIRRVVATTRPDIVCHLAAQSSVTAALRDPLTTLQSNAQMQYHLLEAVKSEQPAARILVVGSSDEYGMVHRDENPVNEQQELRPINPYALSKVVQDLMGLQYVLVCALAVVRVRPFMQLGPRRSARFAVGSFARQIAHIALGRTAPRIVVGSIDLQRDFTDVRDVARAYALAVERGQPGAVYNIASGQAHTLRAVLDAMQRAVGVEAELCQDASLGRPGEPAILIGDAARLRADTGWLPTVSFERSAADTVGWWMEQVRAEIEQQRTVSSSREVPT